MINLSHVHTAVAALKSCMKMKKGKMELYKHIGA